MQHAIAHAEAFAAVPGVFYQQNLRMQLAIFPYDLGRVVARTVVHNQNFRIPILFLHVAQKCMRA